MTRWTNKLKAPFPFYLENDRKNFALIIGLSLFVVMFLRIYRPHADHIDLSSPQQFLFGGVTMVILTFNIIILPRIIPSFFDQWTIGKYIFITFLHMLLIGIASTFIDIYFLRPDRTVWENIFGANRQVIMTGAFPITFLFLFLKNSMLKQNLKDALLANQELEKIKNLKKEIPVKTMVNHSLTILSDTSETLSLHLPDLLFVEADDNYSTFYWKNGAGIQKKLLRVNLKNIETQINNSFAIRCHRSYIVNVNAISNISGNTNGYKLQILDTEFFIPVSRPKGKEVIEKIQQLKNVMELA